MRKFTLSALAVVAALTGGAAIAQTVSPGSAQLALSAGVEPGQFSDAQLIRLIDAQRNNDREEINFILSQRGADVSRSDFGGVSAGAAQLAASVGVEPGALPLNDLVRLDRAQFEDDDVTAAYILSGKSGSGSVNAATNAGARQLAALLGVNPADYTVAELVALGTDQNDND